VSEVLNGRPAPGGMRSDSYLRTYTYLRTIMVALLLALGAAVIFQTYHQRWDPLASVSAYYYTPAQAIFVGVLIALAACMIALKGTNLVEDVFLDLGGMFAAVVAIVPTSRGKDFETALRACRQAGQLLTAKASPDGNCPSLQALEDAIRANVVNNMDALLIVGALGLAATVFFARRDSRGLGAWFWWGFGAAVLVAGAAAVGSLAFTGWFVHSGHYLAAAGLLLCVVVIAVVNALRHQGALPDGTVPATGPADRAAKTRAGLKAAGSAMAVAPSRLDRYAWLAWLMVGTTAVGGVFVLLNALALFWLEIAVALLFAVFWGAQTLELMPRRAPETPPAPAQS